MKITLRRPRGNLIDPSVYEVWNVPRASIYLNGGGSLTSGTPLLTAWDSVEYDTDGMWSSTVNPSRLTAKTSGLYRVTSWFTHGAIATGERSLLIRRTTAAATPVVSYYPGTGVLTEGKSQNATSAGLRTVIGPLSFEMVLSAGDYVQTYMSFFDAGTCAWVGASLTDRTNGLQAILISTI